jgi:hypothetical protein
MGKRRNESDRRGKLGKGRREKEGIKFREQGSYKKKEGRKKE